MLCEESTFLTERVTFVFLCRCSRLQFRLNVLNKEEIVIQYLQPGVEYCVTLAVKTLFNSNAVTSAPHCAFTSPPQPLSSRRSPSCSDVCRLICVFPFHRNHDVTLVEVIQTASFYWRLIAMQIIMQDLTGEPV